MQEYDAVVYDLDGTLVDLVVDWGLVEQELTDRLANAGVDPDGLTAWELLDAGEAAGIGEEIDSLIADHEREGARHAERLPTADELADIEGSAAVCSLNCEEACRIALERHDLDGFVDAVVGRDSVSTRKPDPTSLLAAIEPLSVPPERALFVGDAERDAETAERAGMDFRYVDRGPSGH